MRHPTHPGPCPEQSSAGIQLPGGNVGAPMPTHAPISLTWKALALAMSVIFALVAMVWRMAEARGDDHERRLREVTIVQADHEARLRALEMPQIEPRLRAIETSLIEVATNVKELQSGVTKLWAKDAQSAATASRRPR